MLQKCEGIVLRTTDYGETNKIVTLYTREWGKYGVMARGAKKPKSRLAAITQPLTYGFFLVQKGNGLGNLQQGEILYSLRSIKEDLLLSAYASYIVELTDRSTEERKTNPFLFELLSQSLQYLNEGYDPDIIKNIYELKMLPVLGFVPILNQCAICGSKEGNFSFSIRENGIICHRCLEKDPYHLPLSQATIRLLWIFYFLDIQRLGSISVKEETKAELKRVIDTYYDEYTGLYLKTKRFIDQIKSMM